LLSLQIAHLIQDEKFPDMAYRAFEDVIPGCNTFFIPMPRERVRYVSRTPLVPVGRFAFRRRRFLDLLRQFDLVVLHALTRFNAEVVARADENINFIWLGMGYDYSPWVYGEYKNLLKEESAAYYQAAEGHLGSKLRRRTKAVMERVVYSHRFDRESCIRKIGWFAPVLEKEYRIAVRRNPSLFGTFVDWNYALVSKLVDAELEIETIAGSDILIGNSASITNNHVEAFSYLRNYELPVKSRIFCPLSYGDNAYRRWVIDKGRAQFGERFRPVTEFLGFDDYIELMSRCGVVIMNQMRQQAGGNIAAALYLGAKVFMDPRNLFYNYYKSRGVTVFTIDELKEGASGLGEQLKDKQKIDNRRIMEELWSWSKVREKTAGLIETCIRGN
jgi:hypothetical protein